MTAQARRITQLTLSEALTAGAVLVVIIAIAVPMWRTHQLRERRQDAIEALRAVQVAQDDYFARHARYASESQLRTSALPSLNEDATSPRGHYRISVARSDDDLTYQITARALEREGQSPDARCTELRIDQNGRLAAVDAIGEDTSADCWK